MASRVATEAVIEIDVMTEASESEDWAEVAVPLATVAALGDLACQALESHQSVPTHC